MYLLCMIKARIRWCTCRVENILTLGKLLSLWFCFLLHSILFLISQTSYRTYKIISSYELARPIMGTIFLVINNWASEASPTLGCSIEISRDIYRYVCLSWSKKRRRKYVGLTRACSKSVLGGKIRPVTPVLLGERSEPHTGCSIEISRDICMSVCRYVGMSVVVQKA